MRRLVFIILSIFAIHVCVAQELPTPSQNKDGKWILVNDDGTQVGKEQYSAVSEADNGYFLVAHGGKMKDGILEGEKWGVVDSKGNIVLKPAYDQIGEFINGMATVISNNKIGFVNAQWEIIAEPKYDFVGTPNSQGYVWLNSGGELDKTHPDRIHKGKYGIINSKGDVIVPVKYTSIGTVSDNKHFYDQSKIYAAKNAFERLTLEAGSHYALWPTVLDRKPGSVLPAAIGFAFSKDPNMSRNGIVDLNGKILVDCNVYQRCAMPSDGMALVSTRKNTVGFHDVATNSLVTNPSLRTAFSFKDNIAIGIDASGKWHFYDKKLNTVGDKYNWISPKVADKYFIVKNGDRMAVIRADDYSVIVGDKALIYPPFEGLMVFKDADSELWGFLNQDGSEALKPTNKYEFSFNHGASVVNTKDGWGLLDNKLHLIVKPVWDDIIFPTRDNFRYVWTKTSSQKAPFTCIDISTGELAFKETYTGAWNFEPFNGNEYAAVKSDDKYGYIDPKGKIIIPIDFPSKEMANRALNYKFQRNISQWQPIHSYRFSLTVDKPNQKYKITDVLPTKAWDY